VRKLIFPAALLLSTAAAAQPPRPAAAPPLAAIDSAGQRIERAADALMDVDLGPLLDALSPDGYRGPATLGQVADRRDPGARERMHEDVAATSAGLRVAAREAAVMAPIVRQTITQAVRQIEAAAAQARAQARRTEDSDR